MGFNLRKQGSLLSSPINCFIPTDTYVARDPYKYYFFKCGRERMKNNLDALSERIRGVVTDRRDERESLKIKKVRRGERWFEGIERSLPVQL